MKQYKLFFYRKPNQTEIGPILQTEITAAKSKTAAVRIGKQIAKEREWRFLEVSEPEELKPV
jgi:hypothetical protein